MLHIVDFLMSQRSICRYPLHIFIHFVCVHICACMANVEVREQLLEWFSPEVPGIKSGQQASQRAQSNATYSWLCLFLGSQIFQACGTISLSYSFPDHIEAHLSFYQPESKKNTDYPWKFHRFYQDRAQCRLYFLMCPSKSNVFTSGPSMVLQITLGGIQS